MQRYIQIVTGKGGIWFVLTFVGICLAFSKQGPDLYSVSQGTGLIMLGYMGYEDLRHKELAVYELLVFTIMSIILLLLRPDTGLFQFAIFLCILFLILLALKGIMKQGIGGGDIWLILLTIMLLGVEVGVSVVLTSAVLIGVYSMLYMVKKGIRKSKGQLIPYIPFLYGACLLYIVIK